jgi:hypothetical protein
MRTKAALCACLLAMSICTGVAHAQASTSGVQGKFSGLVYDHATGTFNSVLTLTNTALAPVYSPISVAINTGTPSVTAVGSSSGALSIASIAGGVIQPGQSAQIAVQFLDPSRVSFVPVATSVTAT